MIAGWASVEDGHFGIATLRIKYSLRNCPFCNGEPFFENFKISCLRCNFYIGNYCGGYRGISNNKYTLNILVNTWNGFIKYDESGNPTPECFHKMFKLVEE